jgi:hypothetical protein
MTVVSVIVRVRVMDPGVVEEMEMGAEIVNGTETCMVEEED